MLWIKLTKGYVRVASTLTSFGVIVLIRLFNDFWGHSIHNEGAKKLAVDHLHAEFSSQRWHQSPTFQYKEMLRAIVFFKVSSKRINISFVDSLVVEAKVFFIKLLYVYEHKNLGVQVVPCNFVDDEDNMDL